MPTKHDHEKYQLFVKKDRTRQQEILPSNEMASSFIKCTKDWEIFLLTNKETNKAVKRYRILAFACFSSITETFDCNKWMQVKVMTFIFLERT